MIRSSLKLFVIVAVIAGSGFDASWARDLRITLPKHSELTPVQRLNREGVDAVRKHQFEKAEALFERAYLYDPADPFTLNNLGYISELQGKLDRAQKFYALASEQGSNADIDLSNAKQLEGKPMSYAFSSLKDTPMRVNRMNVEAIELLSEGRKFEAEALLQQALPLDPKNPFTLNNLGVAKEAIGDYQGALKYYDAVASSHSSEPVIVTLNRAWGGKPVSEMAAESARRLQERMKNIDNPEARAAMLNLRGVNATNQNDWSAARQDFLEAYSLDPNSAFSLNNRGYVAESEGDLETAQFFYAKARKAGDANARVGLATQRTAEGQRLSAVATDSNEKVDDQLEKYREARRRQTGPIKLITHDNAPAGDSKPPQLEKRPPSDVAPPAASQSPQ